MGAITFPTVYLEWKCTQECHEVSPRSSAFKAKMKVTGIVTQMLMFHFEILNLQHSSQDHTITPFDIKFKKKLFASSKAPTIYSKRWSNKF